MAGFYIDSFDLAKIIMCICVVAIHTMGCYGFYPFLRIAVPMFFCVSSYLFFRKLDGDRDSGELQSFLIRNTKLYTFWLIILFVPTLILGGWLSGNVVRNAVKFICKIFVGSTFAASWYIPALMICVTVVYILRRKVSNGILLFVAFMIYSICCIASNYRGILDESSIMYKAIMAYPGTIYNSFPVGILWVTLGKILAEGGIILHKKWIYSGELVSLLLLVGEYYFIQHMGVSLDNDCYFMLVPVCFFTMLLLIQSNIKLKPEITKKIRSASTIVYCLHGTIASALRSKLYLGDSFVGSLIQFLMTLLITGVITLMIFCFEEKPNCKWLMWSH